MSALARQIYLGQRYSPVFRTVRGTAKSPGQDGTAICSPSWAGRRALQGETCVFRVGGVVGEGGRRWGAVVICDHLKREVVIDSG